MIQSLGCRASEAAHTAACKYCYAAQQVSETLINLFIMQMQRFSLGKQAAATAVLQNEIAAANLETVKASTKHP